MDKVTSEFVKVSSAGLEKLVKDVIQLKQCLSKVLSTNTMLMLHKKIHSLEQEVARLKQELELKVNEQFILRRRHSDNLVDVERLRKENFQLRTQLNVLQEERSEEYEEFLSFVIICLTIIWHASLKDECVESMIARVGQNLFLTGQVKNHALLNSERNHQNLFRDIALVVSRFKRSKCSQSHGLKETIIKFLEFVSQSLGSFSEVNKDNPEGEVVRDALDSNSQEYKLVLSVTGIITNIAATPLGRDYLSSKEHGIKALDALIVYLTEAPVQKCATAKSLVLKALHNISINKTGLKYLTSKKGLITTLGCLLKDETDADLRISCINCILSIITEPDNPSLAHQLIEVVSFRKLQEFSDLSKGELKKVTLELISDLREVLYRQSQT